MKYIIADRLRDTGFGTRVYSGSVFAYLKTRDIAATEVVQALGQVGDLIEMRPMMDPYRWNRKGVLIRV